MYYIKDVVKQLNIGKETVRYYEKIGLLKNNRRDENGYRLYSDEDLDQLKFILLAKEYDFKLKEIEDLFNLYNGREGKEIVELLDKKINEVDKKIKELRLIEKVLKKVQKDVKSKKDVCYCGKTPKEILDL